MAMTDTRKAAGAEGLHEVQALLKALAFGSPDGLTREQKYYYDKARAAYREKAARFGFKPED